ncbi:beta-ketoacyl reductase [Thermocatellispora tengchongensis]|uniref:beta-ketoacyl reductase n=1 Tax=Thermocatellispora tengchongensis TaxID=1073253 RepID=UPI00363D0936
MLFSSVTGVIGTAGQGNYAPGNAVLDALAEHRRAAGLPATSIAWGHWAGDGIAGPEAERELRRSGLLPMDPGLAVAALGEALDRGETTLIVARADWAAVAASRPGPLLSELAGPASDEEGEGPDLAARLAALPEPERRRTLRELVRAEAAAVLGHASPAEVDAGRGFRDQGFTSLSGVELRNRLAKAAGVTLPSTLVFDHPTPAELADHLYDLLAPQEEDPLDAVAARVGELAALLSRVRPADRSAALDRLRRLTEQDAPAASGGSDLSTASDEELISFISDELGIS